MSNGTPVYPVGQLAKTVKDIVSKYTEGVYYVDEVVKQVQIVLPKAKCSSIRGLLIFEYKKRGWVVETNIHDRYRITSKFGRKITKRKSKQITGTGPGKAPTGIVKYPDTELTFAEIGQGIVAYVNKLKTLADIAEEENVKLTTQVNKLQAAFNKMKLEGSGINVDDILV